MDTFLLPLDDSPARPWTAVPRRAAHLDFAPTAEACAPRSPERLLMLAVLQQAFLDVGRGDLVGRPGRALCGGRSAMHDAIRWFASTDRSHTYAFHAICDVLGLDPREIRRVLHSPRQSRPPVRRAA